VTNQFIRLGAARGAMRCIGRETQRSRWADLAHRRPGFLVCWASLCSSYGQPDQLDKHALSANAKTRSNEHYWVQHALGSRIRWR